MVKGNDYVKEMENALGFLPSPEQLGNWLKKEREDNKGNSFTLLNKFSDSCKESKYYCDIANELVKKILAVDFKNESIKLRYVMFLKALIYYIFETCQEDEKNFDSLIKLTICYKIDEDDVEFKNVVDFMMEDLEKENPYSFAVKYYNCFKFTLNRVEKLYCCNHCLDRMWNHYGDANVKFTDYINENEEDYDTCFIDEDYFNDIIKTTRNMVFQSDGENVEYNFDEMKIHREKFSDIV